MSAVVSTRPAIAVSGIDFSYGNLQVLFGVDLRVDQGETLALLGTNGAGKSTLLRVICGLGRPQSGEVVVAGQDVTRTSPEDLVRLGVLTVHGGRAVFPALSVDENLQAAAFTIRRQRSLVEERRESVLELFPSLKPCLPRRAGNLSGGEQQMLAIGKALMLDPQILLIDEFSLGLAPNIVGTLIDAVEALKTKGVTIVLVEQSINVALTMAERAVFMEKGEVKFEGPAAELIDREDIVRAVFLGSDR